MSRDPLHPRPPAEGGLVVNARFRAQPASTGVHFWAASVLAALEASGTAVDEVVPRAGSGAKGHAWEQAVLPALYRRRGSALPLLSPCNWGPLAVRHQAVVLHDVAPLVVPEHFSRQYVALARVQLPLLARRAGVLLAVSEGARRDIVRVLPVREEDVVLVGMGTRPLPSPDPALAARLPQPCFAFVGAHDARKNLAFLLRLWPEVHARTGAHLVVTRRPAMRTNIASASVREPWYHELVDPSDSEMSAVLAGARALLWPSHYEGFGMPLLEAYQAGTGFVATDTGAAAELAPAGGQVLPLEPGAWIDAVCALVDRDPGSAEHRRAAARRYTWEATAGRVLEALRS